MIESVGSGETASVWKVEDRFHKAYTLNWLRRQIYKSHSIDSEMQHTMKLNSRRFAQIVWYGEPNFEDQPTLQQVTTLAYAVVVEWVDGDTLEEFCAKQGEQLDVRDFLNLASDLCEALAVLNECGLCHNDLHQGNILISRERSGPTREEELILRVIDTGSLKTVSLRTSLIEQWRREASQLEPFINESGAGVQSRIDTLRRWSDLFACTDQEWVVAHFCTLINALRLHEHKLPGCQRRFIREITQFLKKMVGP